MNRMPLLLPALFISLLFSPEPSHAQKGAGEASGVARQAVKPAVVTLSGELLEIKTGPCENTTGRSPAGTHLILKGSNGMTLNVHLGPENAVDHVVEQLTVGQALALEAFRTDRLPENHYIAKSLLLDDKTIHLRDDKLRPSWAYGRGMGKRGGEGMGSGRGDSWGRCR